MPENLDKRLQQIANARNRALSAQVITMLSQAADEEKRREQQAQTLVSIQRRRFTPPRWPYLTRLAS